jgi:ABC-2 type transport system permease protein
VSKLLRRFIRAASFVSKEIAEVRRQPRLILSLILGPFLILLLFGIGYRGENPNLRAIVIVPETGNFSRDAQEYTELVGGQVNIQGVSTDLQGALNRLNRREVDIVVQVPGDAASQIAAGAQARLPIYFNEVDPLRRDYITYLVYLYTNEINKQTLAAAAGRGQESATDLRSAIVRMRNSLQAVEERLAQGDGSGANGQVREMRSNSANLQLGVLLLAQVLASDTAIVKPAQAQDPQRTNLARGQEVTSRLNTNLEALNEELARPTPDPQRIRERIGNVRQDLDDLDRLTQQFQSINPLVLASPFYAVVENQAPIPVSFTSFYAPGVLVLLLQHIAVTLAALSMVRERMLGTVELFRVSPVSPSEIMAGKYVSFMIFLGLIAALLLLLLSNNITVEGWPLSLGVPILGNYALLALTIAFVIFASVGLGFLIAGVTKTESQAVQLSMLVLLASVFFSGFFLRIETFWLPVRMLAYALPVTYGVSGLQVTMLRGGAPSPVLLIALLMLGAFFALVSFLLFNREFRRG